MNMNGNGKFQVEKLVAKIVHFNSYLWLRLFNNILKQSLLPPLGLHAARKQIVTTLPLCNEPDEKEKLEGASLAPPPAAPWKKPVNSNEPPVMINGVQAFKKTSTVVQISPLRTAFIPTPTELKDLAATGPVSKDAEFQKNQLVPRVFLSEPLWSQLVPSNFITRTQENYTTLPCSCMFVLEPQPGKILFRPIHFVVMVTGPRDNVVPVQMRIDSDETGKELRYLYCFRPQKPGTYTAKVRLAASGLPHICQSPLKFHVNRNVSSYAFPPLPKSVPQENGECHQWSSAVVKGGSSKVATEVFKPRPDFEKQDTSSII
ncbi:unnamed protein product [Allacma fusca]|uniref:Uncharacterized protein n=1 Tax=Allacma fusca TaxID=39272 RepID=A0A8J2M6S6_9HEXA|nr:unnamed protein product [Allacma fusca]